MNTLPQTTHCSVTWVAMPQPSHFFVALALALLLALALAFAVALALLPFNAVKVSTLNSDFFAYVAQTSAGKSFLDTLSRACVRLETL
mmetsp:Transcript_2299/g.4793  ORF Transcript_2299/g.4793 Transcript_2299/m.4793 type:complete len:88 (-) Transcript_2299:298-561(-)